jgi:hypothetical protein
MLFRLDHGREDGSADLVPHHAREHCVILAAAPAALPDTAISPKLSIFD